MAVCTVSVSNAGNVGIRNIQVPGVDAGCANITLSPGAQNNCTIRRYAASMQNEVIRVCHCQLFVALIDECLEALARMCLLCVA